MANVNTSLFTAQSSGVGLDKQEIGNVRGRVRAFYFEVTGAAVQAIADTLTLLRLPAGSRVVGWDIQIPSTGTTGICKIGNLVSADAVVAADDDAFGSGYDAGGAAVLAKPAAGHAGHLKRFASEVDVVLAWTEATDVGNVLIKGAFYIVQD